MSWSWSTTTRWFLSSLNSASSSPLKSIKFIRGLGCTLGVKGMIKHPVQVEVGREDILDVQWLVDVFKVGELVDVFDLLINEFPAEFWDGLSDL